MGDIDVKELRESAKDTIEWVEGCLPAGAPADSARNLASVYAEYLLEALDEIERLQQKVNEQEKTRKDPKKLLESRYGDDAVESGSGRSPFTNQFIIRLPLAAFTIYEGADWLVEIHHPLGGATDLDDRWEELSQLCHDVDHYIKNQAHALLGRIGDNG